MARLKRVNCSGPGITRRRRGKGFEYRDEEGRKIDEEEVLARIRELAIPPAWQDVWICPYPMGHIQATGIDARGRKQYRYHDKWRERRDQKKFDDMIDFARALPGMRAAVARDLASSEELTRERALACAVRLLDRGFFRIGGEDYAAENETYGLATMHKRHVTVRGGLITFDYPAKSGQRRVQAVLDPDAGEVVERLKRRRGGGDELLAYKRGRAWVDLKSEDINEYVKAVTGGDFTAKDFRTWSATVMAAVGLAVSGQAARSKTARKRAISRIVKEVALYLGNTPAVCRASYIDPRVFDRYEDGVTIAGAFNDLGDAFGDPGEPSIQGGVEDAVLDLITGEESEALEKVA